MSTQHEDQGAERAGLRLRVATQAGQVVLSTERKWRRAIELGDLKPETIVEASRGGEASHGPASDIPELASLFVQSGFILGGPETLAADPAPAEADAALFPDAAWHTLATFTVERPPVPAAPSESAPPTAVGRDSWEAISKAENPGPDPVLANRLKWVGPEEQRRRALPRDVRRGVSLALGGLAILMLLAGTNPLWPLLLLAAGFAIWPWPPLEAGRQARETVRERKAAWEGLLKEWHGKAGRARWDSQYAQLKAAKQGLDALDRRRAGMLAALDSRENQLKEHLAAFPIEAGRIPGIGPAQARALQAIGYRTAADLAGNITTIAAIGEGPTRTLVGWRAGCAATFVHDPNRSKEPERIRKIDDQLNPERRRLEKPFEGALKRLHDTRAEIVAARADLQPRMRNAWFALCEARLARRAL